jgi:hypothetical protein
MTPMGNIALHAFTLEAPNQHRKLHKLGVDRRTTCRRRSRRAA